MESRSHLKLETIEKGLLSYWHLPRSVMGNGCLRSLHLYGVCFRLKAIPNSGASTLRNLFSQKLRSPHWPEGAVYL